MIEERYGDRLHPRSDFQEEAHLFMGSDLVRGNVCVAPELRSWMAEELNGEVAIAKERRQAREERQLTRAPAVADAPTGGPKGKDGKPR